MAEVDRAFGVSREVFLVGPWAVKVPQYHYGWRNFLIGLLGNMREREWGRARLAGICPVIWAVPGGFLLVARRARPLTDAEWDSLDAEMFCERGWYAIPAEHKRDSFGVLDGQIVAVDYGDE